MWMFASVMHLLNPHAPPAHPCAVLLLLCRGSQRNPGGWSPPGGGSPRPSLGALPETVETLLRRVHGPGSTGVRRNLSGGLGLAGEPRLPLLATPGSAWGPFAGLGYSSGRGICV